MIKVIKIKNHTVGCGGIWVIEHLLSALYGLNIDNIIIECEKGEIPFWDGSSKEITESIKDKIIDYDTKAKYLNISKVIKLTSKNTLIIVKPFSRLAISLSIKDQIIKNQVISFRITPEVYIKEIAPARTYAYIKKDDPRISHLPPYGIGITKDRIFSREPLRFEDEFVRHKILDLIGDLSILGFRLKAKIIAQNTSHRLNHRLDRVIMEARGTAPLLISP